MDFINVIVLPNILYLFLVAGIWLAALALVSPGTGVLELLAFLAMAIVGIGTLWIPFNAWALFVLAGGVFCFGASLRLKNGQVWLVFSAIALVFGSAFLFKGEGRGPAVSPIIVIPVSLLTVGYFWIAIRQVVLAHHVRPSMDLAGLEGKVGEVRTHIDPIGSVFVDGEMWTATSTVPVEPGMHVRVIGREKLILNVEPYHESKEA
ncbi:MAG: hypothetical protein JXA97_11465 [Anaerolineales bacterium]|nr:hypothetical protein [Anaerolineales bacterium]